MFLSSFSFLFFKIWSLNMCTWWLVCLFSLLVPLISQIIKNPRPSVLCRRHCMWKSAEFWQWYLRMRGFAATQPCPDLSHTWTSSYLSLPRPLSLTQDSGSLDSLVCKPLSVFATLQSAKSCTHASPWFQSPLVPHFPLLPYRLSGRTGRADTGSSLLTLKQKKEREWFLSAL